MQMYSVRTENAADCDELFQHIANVKVVGSGFEKIFVKKQGRFGNQYFSAVLSSLVQNVIVSDSTWEKWIQINTARWLL